MTPDLFITWASGRILKAPSFRCFRESLRRQQASLVIFTQPDHWASECLCPDEHTRIVPCGRTSPNLLVERHKHIADYLASTKPDVRFAIHLDARDVVLLRDIRTSLLPFEGQLLLFDEGMTHADSVWNQRDQALLQGTPVACETWPVINGGVQIGPPEKIEALSRSIWAIGQGKGCSDQAILNRLYQNSLRNNCQLISPRQSGLVVHGSVIERGLLDLQLGSDGQVWGRGLREPYGIFHQWDRTSLARWVYQRF
ncbi:MAG: hypothetical protein AB7K24_13575, partial [Gemmataceae bacterium]